MSGEWVRVGGGEGRVGVGVVVGDDDDNEEEGEEEREEVRPLSAVICSSTVGFTIDDSTIVSGDSTACL